MTQPDRLRPLSHERPEPFDEIEEASGLRPVPAKAAEWREALSKEGAVSPMTEALLGAYARLEREYASTLKREQALSFALDRLPLAVFVFERGHVVASNQAARSLHGQGFDLSSDVLRIANEEAQSQLDTALANLSGEPITLTAPITGGLLRIAIYPMGERVILVASNPDQPPRALPKLYQGLFQLTPTEAKVASYMVQGQAPREIAQSLGVGVETTRTHVKHILSKMRCHRQVEVVRKLVTSAALLG